MDSTKEVIIPTFVNAHLFWIVPYQDIFLRAAMNRVIKNNNCKKNLTKQEISHNQIVAINFEGIWARGVVKSINPSLSGTTYVCWLLDYGLTRSVNSVYHLPEDLLKCPHLAKQASLHNVVNLYTDLVLEDGEYELKLKKTLNDIDGIKTVFMDYLERAEKIYFNEVCADRYNVYGDVICVTESNKKQSLTEYLIEKNLVSVDASMFDGIEKSRDTLKNKYFQHSPNWVQKFEHTEKINAEDAIFTRERNNFVDMEFFNRKNLV